MEWWNSTTETFNLSGCMGWNIPDRRILRFSSTIPDLSKVSKMNFPNLDACRSVLVCCSFAIDISSIWYGVGYECSDPRRYLKPSRKSCRRRRDDSFVRCYNYNVPCKYCATTNLLFDSCLDEIMAKAVRDCSLMAYIWWVGFPIGLSETSSFMLNPRTCPR